MSARARAGWVLGALALGDVAALSLGFLGHLHPAFDSLSVFRMQGGLAALLLLAAAMMLRARTPGLIAAAAFVISLAGVLPYALNGAGEDAGSAATGRLKLLSFNLNLANRAPAEVEAWIAAESPDVIALQEVSTDNDRVLANLEARYPAQFVCRFTGYISTAVLTRLPLKQGSFGCAEQEGLAWARVEGPDGPVTIASIHLRWPWPYAQEQQLDALEPLLEGLERPVLISGDFNALPWSEAVARVARASGTRRVGGLGFTLFKPHFLLPLPIDHVLAHPDLAVGGVSVGPDLGSDHRPVRALFR
ncbi:endonuclease/exonuclease/phosphatase family protein [Oceanicella sp. SM1341]|uniref:endonuclease/exonuclease/phosphatase family protein n=1 Tax=Oceanicella sp. SM1341 TaxID=1548889 RepID=UPI000E4D18EA|nr:endonuclease/exonuclease/phosphatase family protein [Oceanicella sp. SM1341]